MALLVGDGGLVSLFVVCKHIIKHNDTKETQRQRKNETPNKPPQPTQPPTSDVARKNISDVSDKTLKKKPKVLSFKVLFIKFGGLGFANHTHNPTTPKQNNETVT